MGLDELHDGRHVSDDGAADDGPRHAGDRADGTGLLGCYVRSHRLRPVDLLPGQRLAGGQGTKAWHGHTHMSFHNFKVLLLDPVLHRWAAFLQSLRVLSSGGKFSSDL